MWLYKRKKNGKGKEYHNYLYDLNFEGEYLNDKKDGEGKEYNVNKDLIFEGEYRNGKRWKGKYKIYNYDKYKLIFEGDYKDGIL